MLIKNVGILISSVQEKTNSKTNLPYLAIQILTLDDGTNFNVMERDSERFGLYKPMEKYLVDLKIASSQYGINVSIDNVLKDMGNIISNPITKPKE